MPRQDAETILKAGKEFEKISKRNFTGFDIAVQPLLKVMCREISKQKKRLGGDFAVAQAVVSRDVILYEYFIQFHAVIYNMRKF